MQIQTTVRYHLTLVKMVIIKQYINNAGESMEKREPSHCIDEKVNWYIHYGEQYWDSKKAKNRDHIILIIYAHCWVYIWEKL